MRLLSRFSNTMPLEVGPNATLYSNHSPELDLGPSPDFDGNKRTWVDIRMALLKSRFRHLQTVHREKEGVFQIFG